MNYNSLEYLTSSVYRMVNESLESVIKNTTDEMTMTVYRPLDIALSVICLTVVAVGIPGNLASLIYFLSRGRDIPTRLYTLLSFIDAILCIFILPVGLSLAYNRDPVMFGWPVFCTLWGAVWTWAPYMSVFLIAVLSITRTLVLLNPLRIISKTKVIIVVWLYGIWIAIRMATPMIVEGPTFHYLNKSVECMWMSDRELLNEMSLITVIIFLANPVLPILVSCGISMYVILASIQSTAQACSTNHVNDRKRSATVTLLILTGTYLLLNFPLFLYLSGFTYYYISHQPQKWLNGSVTVDSYLWNLVYVVLIGVNSLANFLIYLFRIGQFRLFLYQLFARSKLTVVSTMQQVSPALSSLHEIISPKPLSKTSSFKTQQTVSLESGLSDTHKQQSSEGPGTLERQLSLPIRARPPNIKVSVVFSRAHRSYSTGNVDEGVIIVN